MAKNKTLNLRLGLDSRQFQKGLAKAQRSMRKFGGKMKNVGSSITSNITMPFAAVAGAGIKMSIDLTKSFTKIETLVGISSEKVAEMRQEVMNLSGETAKGPQELADALFTITSAGLRGSEAMDVLESSAKASAVGLGETQDIARAVTGVLASYGAENISSAEATDTLMAVVREGNLEASSLAPVLGRVTGIASQLGISFAEVGGSIATFTRLGVSSEEAVTGLRGVMNALLKPTDQSREALDSIGMSFDELRASVKDKGLAETLIGLTEKFKGNDEGLAQLIPNVRGLSAVLGTAASQGDDYRKIVDNINNSQGILDEGFDRVSKDSGFKLQQSFQQLKKVGMEIGSRVLPLVVKLATFIQKGAAAFMNLSGPVKALSVGLVAIVAASGPLLTLFGSLTTLLTGLLSPTMLVVAALIGAGVLIYKNWEPVKKTLVDVINYFITLYNESIVFRGIIEGVTLVFKQAYANLVFFAKAGWSIIKQFGANFKSLFGGIGDIIAGVFTFDLDKLKSGLKGVTESLDNVFDPSKNPELKSAIDEHGETIANNLATAIDNTMGQRDPIELVTEEDIQNGVDNVAGFLTDIKNKIQGAFTPSGGGGATTTTQPEMGPETFDNSYFEDEQSTLENSSRNWGEWAAKGQENLDKFNSTFGQAFGQMGAIMNQFYANAREKLKQQTATQVEEAELQHENRLAEIDRMLISDEEKNKLIEQAETDHANNITTIEDNAAAESRKIARKQAKSDKVQAALGVAVNTASGIMKAVAASPLTAGMPWAGIIGGMGAVQLAAVLAAPLPALASGGLAFGESLALVGDNRNARMDPEVIAPLSKLQGMMGGSAVQVYGTIRGEDIVLSSDRFNRRKQRVLG
jgi:TP901 family phage tail tape measure protein